MDTGTAVACRLSSNDAWTRTRSRRSVRAAPTPAATPGVEPARRDAAATDTARARDSGPSPRRSTRTSRWCFAKKAAAFFRMSRSIRSSRFSLRSRASSSRSAVVSPVLPLRPVGARLLDPIAQRRRGQVELAGHRADRLALLQDQAHRAGLELLRELSPDRRPPSASHSWTSYPPFGRCPRNRIKLRSRRLWLSRAEDVQPTVRAQRTNRISL